MSVVSGGRCYRQADWLSFSRLIGTLVSEQPDDEAVEHLIESEHKRRHDDYGDDDNDRVGANLPSLRPRNPTELLRHLLKEPENPLPAIIGRCHIQHLSLAAGTSRRRRVSYRLAARKGDGNGRRVAAASGEGLLDELRACPNERTWLKTPGPNTMMRRTTVSGVGKSAPADELSLSR